MSAPKRNTNAQRAEQAAEAFIHMRVTPRRKSAYVHAARRSPQAKLTEWAQHHLDKASHYKEKRNQ